MIRFALILLIGVAAAFPGDAQNMLRHKGGGGNSHQTISSISLSNSSSTTGLSSGTPVGTLSASLSPATPAFPYTGTNIHLSSSGADSGGACNGTNGANNGAFQIGSGDTLETNGTLTAGSKSICIAAGAAGVTANGQAFTIAVGNLIDAAATLCAANGGGDGSSGTPWHSACIQAALNAAVAGDTVFLAAGNWSLSSTGVNTNKGNITVTGAGSGNTFDALGHPSNGSGGPIGTVTRVATDTTYGVAKGWEFFSCTGTSLVVSHIFFDGSLATAGGNANGTLAFDTCPGANINDIRVLSYNNGSISTETQFYMIFSNNTTVQNSVFANPVNAGGGGIYSGTEVFQVQSLLTMLVKNNIFYQQTANPFYIDNLMFTGNLSVLKNDGIASPNVAQGFGDPGCSNGGCVNGGTTGSFHFFVFKNLFDAGTFGPFVTGGGVNDPGGSGISNDLQWIGNTILATHAAIDSCEWHLILGGVNCNSNVVSSSSEGMQINGFTITNNSIIGSSFAILNATGTGCTTQGAGAACPSSSLTNMTVVNFDAHQNYLSSPSNQYRNDAYTVTPSVSNNVGTGSGGMGQMDVPLSSFTAAPTCAFTLGVLSAGAAPFATATFAAQYGSVQWLASTSPTTPTSGGQAGTGAAWSYLPPVSLAATHGNTVYMWVMDSANHISSAASALVP